MSTKNGRVSAGTGPVAVDELAEQDLERLEVEPGGGITRRRMVGYLIAGPTLAASVTSIAPTAAEAAAPPSPTSQAVDAFDLTDILTATSTLTNALIKVSITSDGRAHFELPRAEVGQGITTAFSMMLAHELDTTLDRVIVTLKDAAPELVHNQLTGGSNSVHSLFDPVRQACATVKGQMTHTAAKHFGVDSSDIEHRNSVVHSRSTGKSISYAELSTKAAVTKNTLFKARPKKLTHGSGFYGTEVGRVDAHDAVTGKKLFALDYDVPNAMPAMVCRAPTINGSPQSVLNMAQVKAMPGVTDVLLMPHDDILVGGVAVVAKTMGQCMDAIRVMKVKWAAGPVDSKSRESVLADLKNSELPFTLPVNSDGIDTTYIFNFRPGDPLETNSATANVTADHVELWAPLKAPIWCKEQLEQRLKLPADKVKVHCTEGGGSFGRHLFCDAPFEAAIISHAIGKPVRLMWHRTDNFRQGRVHPMTISRVKAALGDGNITSMEQRHTGVANDLTQGTGELLTAYGEKQPGVNFTSFSETVFVTTASVPYNVGTVTQLLNEIYAIQDFNTSSVRNVYSPDMRTAIEMTIEQIARKFGMDPVEFRRKFIRDDRLRNVFEIVVKEAGWGKAMPAGTAQGIGIHNEYKSRVACIVEIDCRPATVNRKIRDAYTGPRVTKATYVADVGFPINVLGVKAQIMGGMIDGISQALTYGMHLKNGQFAQGSWDDAYYSRQWNTPLETNIIVLPATSQVPGGSGELGVAAAMAATAAAYYKATGILPTEFPINISKSLDFQPFPFEPSIPAAPTDGLKKAGFKRAKVVKKKKKPTKKKKTTKKTASKKTSTKKTSKAK